MSQKIKSLDQDNVKFLCGLIRNIASIDSAINDLVIATDKVWSSKKYTDYAQEIKHDLEAYIQSSINGLTHLKKKIVDTLPSDADAEENILYLVKDTSVVDDVVYNQYLLIDGVLEPLGNTSIDMSNYYNKDESDAKFALLSNLQTLIDMVGNVSNLETTAKDTLVSAINEIKEGSDDCITKDAIVTTLDDTVTDEQVPSAKEINNFVNRRLVSTVSSVDEVNSTDRSFQTFMIPSTISESVGLPINPKSAWFVIHCSHAKNYKYPTQIAFEYAGAKRIMVRFCVNDTWSEWRKVCATSVPDVGKTVLTLTDSTNYNISTDIDENNCYTVKNGICQVNIDIQCLTATTIHNIFNETLPTPYVGKYMASISSLYSDYTNTNVSYRPITLVIYDNLTILYGGTVGGRYFGSFSYPVADDWQP